MKGGQVRIYGQHACRAVFERRPEDVERVFISEEARVDFGDILKACARARKPYRIVAPEELEKITGARHHEGVCMVTRARSARPFRELLSEEGPSIVVALDQVGNPHNVGALIRTAAHFGVRAMILGGQTRRLSAAASRTAEGGAEYCATFFSEDLASELAICRDEGYLVLGTSSHEGSSLYELSVPQRVVLLLGAEREGLAPGLASAADQMLSIPGTGHVESLNVSNAAAVILAEIWRQQHPG
jgi:TrmH RNA methyltransferase